MAPIASWDYLSTKYLQSKPKNSLINFTLKSHCWKQPQWSDCFFFYRVRFWEKWIFSVNRPSPTVEKKNRYFWQNWNENTKKSSIIIWDWPKQSSYFKQAWNYFFSLFFRRFHIIFCNMNSNVLHIFKLIQRSRYQPCIFAKIIPCFKWIVQI